MTSDEGNAEKTEQQPNRARCLQSAEKRHPPWCNTDLSGVFEDEAGS